MNRHVYHYYAVCRMENGNVLHIDGVARSNCRILTNDDIDALKESIDSDNVERMIISSLSYLGREND